MIGKRIAIDLGTANSLVIVQGRGIVIQEPTVAAFSIEDKKVLAIGNEAKEMLGKVPGNIVARRPLKNGAIAYYKLTEAFLKQLMDKAIGRSRFFKPEVMISIPAGITSVEERAVIDAVNSAGAGKVYLLPEPIAAAIGAGMPIHTSAGNMIVNMGGGTSEIAILSLNGLVLAKSERTAGDAINNALIDYVRKKYGLLIGEQMAEVVKMKIGSAVEVANPKTMEVRGRDLNSGLPQMIQITSNQTVHPIRTVLNKIIYSIKDILEQTPPELASDIIDYGIVLSGGTAMLTGIDELFTRALGVPVHVVDEPLTAVVRGLSHALDHLDVIKRSLRG
jgi:rod shape-determining protein MreB